MLILDDVGNEGCEGRLAKLLLVHLHLLLLIELVLCGKRSCGLRGQVVVLLILVVSVIGAALLLVLPRHLYYLNYNSPPAILASRAGIDERAAPANEPRPARCCE